MQTHHPRRRFGAAPALLLGILLAGSPAATLPTGSTLPDQNPAYDAEGRLELPEDFARWILAGSSLALSYTEAPQGHEMFHFTLIEPSAYAHFEETGTFREGTMLALLLHGVGEGALPSRQGRYAAEAHMLELAVKDSSRNEGSWAYYNFTGTDGLRESAAAMPRESCQACHAEHAALDNVFLQFYPLLVDAAPEGTLPAGLGGAFRRASTPPEPSEPRTADAVPASTGAGMSNGTAALALGGLDPVHLARGRREMGKAEIVMEHAGYRYQFVSEPSRQSFEDDPGAYLEEPRP